MAFDSLIRSGIKLADKLTTSLQAKITLHAWISNDLSGDPIFADPIDLLAIVDYNTKQWNFNGKVITVQAVITFPRPIAPNGADGRIEPIDLRDKIILPNGSTGPIVYSPNSIIDPITGRGYLTEIGIGSV